MINREAVTKKLEVIDARIKDVLSVLALIKSLKENKDVEVKRSN